MENRISQLSITPTVGRQTPKDDFGERLARGITDVARHGRSLLQGVPGLPVVSAAVAAASPLVTSRELQPGAMAKSGPMRVPPQLPEGSSPPAGNSWDMLEAQRFFAEEDRSHSLAYLGLQRQMQEENRQYNTVTNVMKVRHDSAKAAINNVR
jgi:hypothetical protein